MPEPESYILVCAPSGCGLTHAASQLRLGIGDGKAAHEDIEDILLKALDTKQKLEAKGFAPSEPNMYQITWYLARSEVTSLWRAAAQQALLNLSRTKTAFRMLSCHLTYYGGRRTEFYSPIESSTLNVRGPEGDIVLKPSHVLLLID